MTRLVVAVGCAIALLAGCAAVDGAIHGTFDRALDAASRSTERWRPPVGATWQIQLQGAVDTSVDAQVYDVDLFDVHAAQVDALKRDGRRVICYLSAGTMEDWRGDASRFP